MSFVKGCDDLLDLSVRGPFGLKTPAFADPVPTALPADTHVAKPIPETTEDPDAKPMLAGVCATPACAPDPATEPMQIFTPAPCAETEDEPDADPMAVTVAAPAARAAPVPAWAPTVAAVDRPIPAADPAPEAAPTVPVRAVAEAEPVPA